MKKLYIATPIICVALAAAGYVGYHNRAGVFKDRVRWTPPARSSNKQAASLGEPVAGGGDAGQQDVPPPPPPPPPPFPGTPPVREARPEPVRSLIGATEEDLREVERYLPEGAKVYTYPVSESSLAAAIMTADLDGDGKDETVLVYADEKLSTSLVLSVLAQEKNALRLVASTRMVGGVLFDLKLDGKITHLAARDIVGDSRPELIVAPATGASAGGALEVYMFEDSALQEIARIGGHFFKLRGKRRNKPSLITARWNGEKEVRTYEWSGEAFEQVGRPKSQ